MAASSSFHRQKLGFLSKLKREQTDPNPNPKIHQDITKKPNNIYKKLMNKKNQSINQEIKQESMKESLTMI